MIFKYVMLGALSGFFSSTPLGPINLWMVDHQFSKLPKARLFSFLAAVILVDIFLATMALWGHFELLEESAEVRWAGILSGAFTVFLGVVFFMKGQSPVVVAPSQKTQKTQKFSTFLQGLILTGANPAFFLFWLFVANQILSRMDSALSVAELIAFGTGVLLGDVLWFSIFGWTLSHMGQKSQESTLQKIRMGVGIVFIVLGLIAIGTYVSK